MKNTLLEKKKSKRQKKNGDLKKNKKNTPRIFLHKKAHPVLFLSKIILLDWLCS